MRSILLKASRIALMDAARGKGHKIMSGEVLKSNANMLKLMNRLGFGIDYSPEEANIKRVSKVL